MVLIMSWLRTAPLAVTQRQPAGAASMAVAIEIVNSTISGNSAGTSGGGIYEFGAPIQVSLDVRNSTITGNSAPSGGGIYNERFTVGHTIVEISPTQS